MSEEDHKAEKQRGSAEAGLIYVCSVLTGFAGIFGAGVSVASNSFTGGGLFLLASAFAFGLLANALFRR